MAVGEIEHAELAIYNEGGRDGSEDGGRQSERGAAGSREKARVIMRRGGRAEVWIEGSGGCMAIWQQPNPSSVGFGPYCTFIIVASEFVSTMCGFSFLYAVAPLWWFGSSSISWICRAAGRGCMHAAQGIDP